MTKVRTTGPRTALIALALIVCTGGGVEAGQQEAMPSGARLYLDCGACHGKDGGGVAGDDACFISAVLFGSGRPVFIVPYIHKGPARLEKTTRRTRLSGGEAAGQPERS